MTTPKDTEASNEWQCVYCKSLNLKDDLVCGICAHPKPEASTELSDKDGNLSPEVNELVDKNFKKLLWTDPPVALERELSKLIEKRLWILAMGDFVTESRAEKPIEIALREILTEVTHTIEEAVVASKEQVYFDYLDELVKLQPGQPKGDVLEAFDKATLAVARVTDNKDAIARLEGLQE